MSVDVWDKPYDWYQDLFCRDLGLCNRSEQDWGWINFDSRRVGEFAEYYLSHAEYSRVGREMLVESLLSSFQELLTLRPQEVTQELDDLMCRAVAMAIGDLYDRDSVALHWDGPDERKNRKYPNPIDDWLHRRFPGWIPPPSVWSLPEGTSPPP
jgi:hypothetical protein